MQRRIEVKSIAQPSSCAAPERQKSASQSAASLRFLAPLFLAGTLSGLPSAVPAQVAAKETPAPAKYVTEGDGSRFGVTKKAMAPEFKAIYDYRSKAKSLSDATFPAQTAVHRAHTLMLAEQGIITKAEAAAILKGLEAVNEQAAKTPAMQAYMVYERALIKEVGEVAGKMHIGRSRNDLGNAINRMYYRDEINDIVESLIALRQALATKAQENLDTVMPVYTHRKQAQPVTLGHYLMAHAEALGRGIDRYEDLYRRMNLSPMGSAASTGTGFKLDRERTAELLGFDGLVVNTIDGVAAWDHIAELSAVNASYLSQMSRLASELQLWGTDEYATLDLDGGYIGSSSIMPQKRNAYSLEYIRLAASEALGDTVSVTSSMNNVEYQYTEARVALEPRTLDRVVVVANLMAGIVRTMTPSKARMRQLSTDGFSTMTELADTLVRESSLSFRDADEVMADVVQETIAQGKQGREITAAQIKQAAHDVLGRSIELSDASVKAALDPGINVARRDDQGGPAPSAVQGMIDDTNKRIAEERSRLVRRREKLARAADMLGSAEDALVKSAQAGSK